MAPSAPTGLEAAGVVTDILLIANDLLVKVKVLPLGLEVTPDIVAPPKVGVR